MGIWDVSTNQHLTIPRYEHAVVGVEWSGVEQRILMWSDDRAARLWRTDVKLLSQDVCELIPRNFTEAEWSADMGTEPYQRTARPMLTA